MLYQLSLCLVWEAEEWEEQKESPNTQKVSLRKPAMNCSTSVSFVKKQMGKFKDSKWDVTKKLSNRINNLNTGRDGLQCRCYSTIQCFKNDLAKGLLRMV